MEDVALIKVLLLLSFSLRSSSDTHSLEAQFTAVTPGINFPAFTAVGLLDGQQCVYYDSNIMKTIPKAEWVKNISVGEPDYSTFMSYLGSVMLSFNQTEGVHTLQRMYGCELHDDNTTKGYDQFGYDGEDFISLDLNTETWIADKPEAEIFIKEWESTSADLTNRKSFLEKSCIKFINNYVPYSRETLERKDPPTSSVFLKLSPSEVVCHATGFFPKEVMISWKKDGEDVKEDVELRETLPNQDGSFQKRIILKVSAEDLQKHNYTCVIQHSSLKEEMVLDVNKQKIPEDAGSD